METLELGSGTGDWRSERAGSPTASGSGAGSESVANFSPKRDQDTDAPDNQKDNSEELPCEQVVGVNTERQEPGEPYKAEHWIPASLKKLVHPYHRADDAERDPDERFKAGQRIAEVPL
jgi:hypothetical protein